MENERPGRIDPVFNVSPPIHDKFLDLPKRTKVISEDDILNLRIALNTMTISEMIEQL